MPNYFVINNPYAGDGVHSSIVLNIKNTPNIVAWHDTDYAGHAMYLAKKLAKTIDDPTAVVLVIGGDGTLNDVLNGLLQFKRDVKLPIAYIPTGSGNDFARGINLGTAEQAVSHLKRVTQAQMLNIGKINGDAPHRTTKYFVNSIGIGFDAAVVAQTNQTALKKRLNKLGCGSLSYLLSVLCVFFKQHDFQMTLMNGEDYIQIPHAFLVTLTNQVYFGGGIAILPGADAHQNELDMVVAEKMSFIQFLAMFASLKKNGGHLQFKSVHKISLARGANIHVRDIQPGQIDGEELGNGTFSFNIDYQTYPFWL